MPIGLLDQPNCSILFALVKPKTPQPRLNAREAVRVKWLLLVGKLLQPLVLRRRQLLRLRQLRGATLETELPR